jgi:hypothetical protein
MLRRASRFRRANRVRRASVRFVAPSAAGGLLLIAAVSGAPAQAATAPLVSCVYTIQDAWSGGFTAQIEIANNGPTALNGWTVRWSFNERTTDISAWQSTLTAPDGIHATATNASYNGTILSGHSTAFGWSARSATATSVPTGLTVNGAAC